MRLLRRGRRRRVGARDGASDADESGREGDTKSTAPPNKSPLCADILGTAPDRYQCHDIDGTETLFEAHSFLSVASDRDIVTVGPTLGSMRAEAIEGGKKKKNNNKGV